MSLLQRIHDWRHERHIRRLSIACREAYDAGDKAKAYQFDRERMDAILARSPAQIARMERRMGLL